jgi:hypothetical protein
VARSQQLRNGYPDVRQDVRRAGQPAGLNLVDPAHQAKSLVRT